MNTDLTEGNVLRKMISFSIPMLISVFFQQIYTIADSIIAGKFINEQALAAVGNSYEITLIFLAFATGTNMGCSIVISRYFGAKDFRTMKTAVSTAIISSITMCAILTAAGLVFCPSLLRLINTPDEIFADSVSYMNIYISGTIFLIMYNVLNGIFTAMGDSRSPLIFLIVSSCLNVALDILFVTVFNAGVKGVAIATVAAQSVSCIISVITLIIRLRKTVTEETNRYFSVDILKELLNVSIPSIIQQSTVSIGNIVIQGRINEFGTPVVAGYSAGVKLHNFVVTAFVSMSNAVSTFTSQNIGAKKPERIGKGIRSGTLIAFILAIPFVIFYMIFTRTAIGLFITNPTEEAVSSGMQFLRIVTPCYFLIITKVMCDGVIKGSKSMGLFMIDTFSDLVVRVVLAYVFSYVMNDSVGIWLAFPAGWIVGTAVSVIFYKCGLWKKHAV